MAPTAPTIASRIAGSRMASTGISTLCSTAIARARASISLAAARTR
jgi:hypothetical protein